MQCKISLVLLKVRGDFHKLVLLTKKWGAKGKIPIPNLILREKGKLYLFCVCSFEYDTSYIAFFFIRGHLSTSWATEMVDLQNISFSFHFVHSETTRYEQSYCRLFCNISGLAKVASLFGHVLKEISYF